MVSFCSERFNDGHRLHPWFTGDSEDNETIQHIRERLERQARDLAPTADRRIRTLLQARPAMFEECLRIQAEIDRTGRDLTVADQVYSYSEIRRLPKAVIRDQETAARCAAYARQELDSQEPETEYTSGELGAAQIRYTQGLSLHPMLPNSAAVRQARLNFVVYSRLMEDLTRGCEYSETPLMAQGAWERYMARPATWEECLRRQADIEAIGRAITEEDCEYTWDVIMVDPEVLRPLIGREGPRDEDLDEWKTRRVSGSWSRVELPSDKSEHKPEGEEAEEAAEEEEEESEEEPSPFHFWVLQNSAALNLTTEQRLLQEVEGYMTYLGTAFPASYVLSFRDTVWRIFHAQITVYDFTPPPVRESHLRPLSFKA